MPLTNYTIAPPYAGTISKAMGRFLVLDSKKRITIPNPHIDTLEARIRISLMINVLGSTDSNEQFLADSIIYNPIVYLKGFSATDLPGGIEIADMLSFHQLDLIPQDYTPMRISIDRTTAIRLQLPESVYTSTNIQPNSEIVYVGMGPILRVYPSEDYEKTI